MSNCGGRPSIYSDELAKTICNRIAGGEGVKTICSEPGMPHHSTVFQWVVDDLHGFSDRYKRARKAWVQAQADEILSIADNASGDIIETERGDKQNTEFILRSKLRVETRRWLMTKFAPETFGDRQEIAHTGANGESLVPVINVAIGAKPESAL